MRDHILREGGRKQQRETAYILLWVSGDTGAHTHTPITYTHAHKILHKYSLAFCFFVFFFRNIYLFAISEQFQMAIIRGGEKKEKEEREREKER